ncbi:MAG TPA: hypothetical protein V6C71_16260 [Coleofasciculaceae cyanobacterium]|jgi:type I restriction enzyme S subunit
MGKLVPQNPNDPPASELLKEIEAERRELIKEGKIPKPKQVEPIKTEEIPYLLPNHWIWTKVKLICAVIVDCPHSTPIFIPEGLLCIDTNSFKAGSFVEHKFRYVSEKTYLDRVKRLVPQENDIVFAREGSIGESVIIPPKMQCCLGQRVMLFRPMQKIFPKYLQLHNYRYKFISSLEAISK